MDPLRGKYTYFQKLLHRFKARRDIPFRRSFFVGYDLHGNTYWEFTVDGNMQRLRRKLEPYEPKLFKADYFSTIPPQWLSWLRRTRREPPTLQELVNDQMRQERIKILAQHADEKWRNEKLRLENEQALKLQGELKRSQKESEEFEKQKQEAINREKSQDDPWAKADSNKDSDPIEPANLKPRNNDPWAEADAKAKSKDSPIETTNIKPRK